MTSHDLGQPKALPQTLGQLWHRSMPRTKESGVRAAQYNIMFIICLYYQLGTFLQSVLFLQIGENSLNQENFYQIFADFDPRSGDFLGIANPAANPKFPHFETCHKRWKTEKEGKFP